MSVDITAVLTGHGEGLVAGATLASFKIAVDHARTAGLTVEPFVMLDRADQETTAVLAPAEQWGAAVHPMDLGDQSKVRNQAVDLAQGKYVAFLDGDDLWSENWLTGGFATCETAPGTVIAHPDMNWYFGGEKHVWFHADMASPEFDPAHLRLAYYWDSLCMAPRQVHRDHPYATRNVPGGFAHEDHHFNLETVAAGLIHRPAPGTIIFKRRRPGSQHMQAVAAKVLTPWSAMFDYAWPGYAALEGRETTRSES